MEIIRNEQHKLSTAFYVVLSPRSSMRPLDGFASASEAASFKAIAFDADGNWPPTPAGHTNIAHIDNVSFVSASGRQRNESDIPPGIGYHALKKSKAYIPMTYLRRSTIFSEAEPQILEHNEILQADGGGCYFNPYPILNEFKYEGFNLEDNPFDFAQMHVKADEHARRNLYASLNKRQAINGGVIIAEMRESMNLLGKACSTLLLAIREVKRGRIDKAFKILSEHGGGLASDKTFSRHTRASINRSRKKVSEKPISKGDYASSSWLELQFGWMPIISDIYKLIAYIEEAASGLETEDVWFSFSGYSSTFARSYKTDSLPGYRAWSKLYGLEFEVRNEVRSSYTATFRMKDPVTDVLNSVGLLNPASIAWEIVPFSFVLDWFVPVGDWIESFTAYAGLELIEVCHSTKRTDTLITNRPSRDYGGYGYVDDLSTLRLSGIRSKEGKPVRHVRQTFQRSVLGHAYGGEPELPPFPPFKKVDLLEILQPWKLITSLALFKQLAGKR